MLPAAEKLLAYIERIERLEEERKSLADDISDVYKELAGDGYDKDAAKVIVKIRRTDDGLAKWQGASEAVDFYLSSLGMLGPVIEDRAPARAREIIEKFDAETGEITEQEQPETQSSVESRERQTVGVQAQGSVDSPISKPEATPMDDARKGPSGTAAEITPSTAPAVEPEAAPQAPQSVSGEVSDADIPAFIKRDYVLRPHCLNPSLCAGSGSKHCHACLKARDESILADEVAA
jgi:uncharacterized protein (UPF0335 family)